MQVLYLASPLVLAAAYRFAVFVNTSIYAKGTPRDDPVIPVIRNFHFGLKNKERTEADFDDVCTWNPHGRFVSLFLAALSIFFPPGELMFCRAVKAHMRDDVIASDEKLKAAAMAFISQEAVHGREHEYYNRRLADKLPITKTLEKVVTRVTEGVTKFFPRWQSLGATVALEHWTALLASTVLDDEETFMGDAMESRFGLIWRWHAMEETEHKAVAYDVFDRVYGHTFSAWLNRCTSLILASVIFWSLVPVFFLALIIQDGSVFDFQEWGRLAVFLFSTPGPLHKIIGPFFDYMRWDFHPWDHNNVDKLEKMEELAERIQSFDDDDAPVKVVA